jgi:hypothetical protein
MNLLFAALIALLAGAAGGWLLRPILEVRAAKALPFLHAAEVQALTGGKTLAARLEAAIAEIESQTRQGIDRDRNATRLQILHEVRDGD